MREGVGRAARTLELSERRVCKAAGQPRSTQRYRATRAAADRPLVEAMLEVVREHPRYGYRRVHAMLEQDGFKAGRGRVHRLWRKHGLGVPRRTIKRRRLGTSENGIVRHAAARIDHVWSYDFVKDQTADGLDSGTSIGGRSGRAAQVLRRSEPRPKDRDAKPVWPLCDGRRADALALHQSSRRRDGAEHSTPTSDQRGGSRPTIVGNCEPTRNVSPSPAPVRVRSPSEGSGHKEWGDSPKPKAQPQRPISAWVDSSRLPHRA